MEFQSKNPDVKMVGGVIISFMKSQASPTLGQKYLSRYGFSDLSEIKEDGWYSQQTMFNIMKDIADSIGMTTLESIGGKVPDNAKMPAWNNLEEVLDSWTDVYKHNHQGDNISYFKILDKGERHFIVETNNAYPCAFDIGLFRAIAKKFHPKAVVTENKEKCRRHGHDTCTYKIAWF